MIVNNLKTLKKLLQIYCMVIYCLLWQPYMSPLKFNFFCFFFKFKISCLPITKTLIFSIIVNKNQNERTVFKVSFIILLSLVQRVKNVSIVGQQYWGIKILLLWGPFFYCTMYEAIFRIHIKLNVPRQSQILLYSTLFYFNIMTNLILASRFESMKNNAILNI